MRKHTIMETNRRHRYDDFMSHRRHEFVTARRLIIGSFATVALLLAVLVNFGPVSAAPAPAQIISAQQSAVTSPHTMATTLTAANQRTEAQIVQPTTGHVVTTSQIDRGTATIATTPSRMSQLGNIITQKVSRLLYISVTQNGLTNFYTCPTTSTLSGPGFFSFVHCTT